MKCKCFPFSAYKRVWDVECSKKLGRSAEKLHLLKGKKHQEVENEFEASENLCLWKWLHPVWSSLYWTQNLFTGFFQASSADMTDGLLPDVVSSDVPGEAV